MSLIHVDSDYRNIREYENSSEFSIPVVDTEISDISKKNIRVNIEIIGAFQWLGNTDKNTENLFEANPLSKITNDTMKINIIPVSNKECLIVPQNSRISNLIEKDNFFYGLMLFFPYNNKASRIVEYNYKSRTIKCEDNVFKYHFDFLILEDNDIQSNRLEEFYRSCYIINSSFHTNYSNQTNFQILGLSKKNICNIGKNTIIENITRGWKRTIKHFDPIRNQALIDNTNLNFDTLDKYIVYNQEEKTEKLLGIFLEMDEMKSVEIKGYNGGSDIKYGLKSFGLKFGISNYIIATLDKRTMNNFKFYKIYSIENVGSIGNDEFSIIYFLNDSNYPISEYIYFLIPYKDNFSRIDPPLKTRHNLTIGSENIRLSLYKLLIKKEFFDKENMPPYLLLRLNRENTISNIITNTKSNISSDATIVCFQSESSLDLDDELLFESNQILYFKKNTGLAINQIFLNEISFSISLPNNDLLRMKRNEEVFLENVGERIFIKGYNKNISFFLKLY